MTVDFTPETTLADAIARASQLGDTDPKGDALRVYTSEEEEVFGSQPFITFTPDENDPPAPAQLNPEQLQRFWLWVKVITGSLFVGGIFGYLYLFPGILPW